MRYTSAARGKNNLRCRGYYLCTCTHLRKTNDSEPEYVKEPSDINIHIVILNSRFLVTH